MTRPPNKKDVPHKDPYETDLGANLPDFGILPGNDNPIRLDVTDVGKENAIEFPSMGWSSYGSVYNAARVAHLAQEIIDTIPSRDLDPGMAYTREWGTGPVSEALYGCGAQ